MNVKTKATTSAASRQESADTSLSFEKALERLETLVADMESGRLNLEDMLKAFEEGQRLIRFCGGKLEDVERRIEALSEDADGNLKLEPFTASSDGENAPSEPSDLDFRKDGHR